MKLDSLNKRLQTLEPDQSMEDREIREILAKLSDEELDRLEKACIRTEDWKLPLTEDETRLLAELEAKYGPF